MNFLKDFLSIFGIIFCTILILGAMFLLLKAIFVSFSAFISTIVLVFIVSMIYSAVRFINRNY